MKNCCHMGFTDRVFPYGTHMCFIYRDEKKRREVISKFLEAGFLNDEKVGYFADAMKPEEVVEWLLGMGVDVKSALEKKYFEILAAEKVYCSSGKFVPEDMLDKLRAYYKQAKKEGHLGARVSGEMSWALKGIPGSERLIEYESKVNEVVKTYPVTAICQYNANKFDQRVLTDVLMVHPMMVVNGNIVRNPAYIDTEEFLKILAKRNAKESFR